MREITVSAGDEGQQLIRYLNHLLPNAGNGFLFKMLRKKNILLNGKKATGKERIVRDDIIRIYFSEETYLKFRGSVSESETFSHEITVLYEDDDIIAVDKPAGMLSQRDKSNEPSVNDYILSYLKGSGASSLDQNMTFKPSIANRLDRNTSGIILAGKTYKGQEKLSRWLRQRDVEKYYVCLCQGTIKEKRTLTGYLKKDPKTNTVRVSKEEIPGSKYIETRISPIAFSDSVTLLKVRLMTGRPHQIRAHLKSIGHSLLGDPKYSDIASYNLYKEKYGIKHQLLHAAEIVLPETGRIISPIPRIFTEIAKKEGIHGDLEIQGT